MVSSNLISSTNIEKKPYQLSQFEYVRDVSPYSHNDIRELQAWDKEYRVMSDQFHIPIPLKDSTVRLPDNLYRVNSCLGIVLESPHRNKVYDQYDNEISKMQSVGYAEPAPVDPGHADQHLSIYHHTVPKQHNRIRVVSVDTNPCTDVSLRIHSLQEPNVTSSEAELHRILKQHDFNVINKFSTRHTIHWSFHPPTPSHMNGACERMIRIIRKVP